MYPFADVILRVLADLARLRGGPVASRLLADFVPGAALRTIKWYLAKLERAGLVRRRSPRGGWLPA